MPPTIATPTRLLAITLASASAGCSLAEKATPAGSSRPDASAAPAASPAAPAGAPSASASSSSAPPPSRLSARAEQLSPEERARLFSLQGDMVNLPRKQALAQIDRFRPLCDSDGYPLVGNLARKVPPTQGQEADLTASSLCAEIRSKSAR